MTKNSNQSVKNSNSLIYLNLSREDCWFFIINYEYSILCISDLHCKFWCSWCIKSTLTRFSCVALQKVSRTCEANSMDIACFCEERCFSSGSISEQWKQLWSKQMIDDLFHLMFSVKSSLQSCIVIYFISFIVVAKFCQATYYFVSMKVSYQMSKKCYLTKDDMFDMVVLW